MGPSYFILALLIPLLLLLPCLLVLLPFGHRRERAVGFFHPYANDGGGGERVLWCAVRAVQEGLPELNCVIYSGDDATPTSLAERAWERFGVQLPVAPSVVRLHKRWWVEAETYPHFTLLGQCLGSLVLAWEALTKLTPMLFFDTSGYAFSYPLARAFGCKVACYTHYPTINSDMLARVVGRTSMYNNNAQIAGSFILSVGKTFYYRLMAWIYGKVGRCVHLAMVNSSWTQLHIENLWKIPDRIVRVYPPCNTVSLQALSLKRHADNTFIISVAQFRPEKAHVLQLEAFAAVLNELDVNSILYKNYKAGKLRLKLVGSCRHNEDELRVKMLKRKCSELGIEDHVDFLVNVTYTELRELLGGAIAGIHSMTDEHFGIVVVEYMAAGVIPIAHNSAGPKMDIVLDEEGQKIGFLAITVDQYADAMYKVLTMTEEQRLQIAAAARQHSSCFSEGKFDQDFKIAMAPIFLHLKERAGLVHSK